MHDEQASWLSLSRLPGERLADAVERTLREAICERALRPGVRLPSSRALAASFGVSRSVASEAYEQLAAQGYVVPQLKAAPVVADVGPVPAAPAAPAAVPATRTTRFDFTPTTPDVTQFPADKWAASLATAARSLPTNEYDYGDPRGSTVLRTVLADHLGRARGVVTGSDQIMITHGTAQAVDLMARILAAGNARGIAVEDPGLPTQIDRITGHGLAAPLVPVDTEGIVVDELVATHADAVLVTPAHQFPTGVVLSGGRRRELLDWARRHRTLVLEDDYDAEFRYDRQPIRALQGQDPARVVYLGTTSKTLAPALRLGWLVVPEGLDDEALRIRHLLDVCPPAVDQRALASFIQRGDYDRHVRRTRKVYQRRREHLIAALATCLPEARVEGISAGIHALLRLPDSVDDRAIADDAARAGVHVEPLSRFNRSSSADRGLVLGYGRIPERHLDEAVATLARVVRERCRER